MSKIGVVHYPATGHTYEMAEAIVAGAKDAGAEVGLCRVAELAPMRCSPAGVTDPVQTVQHDVELLRSSTVLLTRSRRPGTSTTSTPA
jgi:multimeric flavodoxin WrbA